MKTGATLMDQVRAGVDSDESLAVEAGLLVLAALKGDVALTQALATDGSHAAPISTAADARTASVSKVGHRCLREQHHGARIPRHRSPLHARACAGAGTHAGRGAKRKRQVQLRRSVGVAADR